jgi:hypothetical protein
MTISKSLEFRVKYILPLMAFLVTYAVIGQQYTHSLSENDLISINGQVLAIRQDTLHNNKSEDLRITFRLLTNDNNLFLFANNGESYELILQKVKIGDTISILHRTKLQSIFGIGSEFQIMKLEKDKDVLYSFDESKQTFGVINIFGIFVMVGLWILYFYFKYRLKLKKKQQPT